MTSIREGLPSRRLNTAFTFGFEGHRCHASAGWLAEIFLDCGKPNTPLQLHAATAALLTSLLLQPGVDAIDNAACACREANAELAIGVMT